MSAPQTSSRLQLLQARFQQKQLQEKEQKLLQLYDQQQQRAHQVAQRGSAGSNDSTGSSHGNGISNTPAKVRQMFDERRQSSVKGIDKSYPLEPLDNKSKRTTSLLGNKGISKPSYNMENRRNVESRRSTTITTASTRSDVNSNVNATGKNTTQRDGFARDSYGTNRNLSKNANNRGENVPYRERRVSPGGEDEVSSERNGYTRNGHYEINIDEVIDDEAMQRNRMLAKFHPSDIEKRRRFSGDIDSDEFPSGVQYQHHQPEPSDGALARKKSDGKVAERFKNANVRRSNVDAKKRTESLIPMGGNARVSTLRKTTESASLKVRSPPPDKKRLVIRRKSSLKRRAPKKKKVLRKKESCESCMTNISTDWDALKSTPLICEILRKHSKLHKTKECQKLGRVKAIVMKIENKMIAIGSDVAALPKLIQSIGPLDESFELGTTVLSTAAEVDHSRRVAEGKNESEKVEVERANPEEEADARARHSGAEESARKRSRETKNYEESKTTNERKETKTRSLDGRLSGESVRRVRRASFESKRMMFEQLQQNQDHLEKRTARSEEGNDSAREAGRDRRFSGRSFDERSHRGFERYTSAWLMRISKGNSSSKKKSATPASERRNTVEEENSIGKKLLEARDSIELTRVPIRTNLPACKKKIISNANSFSDKTSRSTTHCARNDNAPEVENQSCPSEPAKEILSCVLNPVNDNIFSSTTRSFNAEIPGKKADVSTRVAEPVIKKNVTPYPSSRSPDNTAEQKSRTVVKSTSLKFLSRIVGTNGGDVPVVDENDTTSGRKINITKADSLDCSTTAGDTKSKSNDEERAAGVMPAPRTSSSLSSSSSLGINRGHGSTGSIAARTGLKAKAPTPAARTSAASNGDDSLITCKTCSRRFASDRIGKHEQICSKTAQKKRKQFDVVTHRVKGTELEAFVRKPSKKQSKAVQKTEVVPSTKSNWRRKHEDFINAIRSAKQMQVHLASGGKLSDLPPPPASDTSDYIQCPHCSRRFNQAAAERHIPKCETMQHNKPRAQPRQTRR